MTYSFKTNAMAGFSGDILGRLQRKTTPKGFRRSIIVIAVIASLTAAVYWIFIASNRYVSEAHVIIQRTDLDSNHSMDFPSLLGGTSINRADQLLLRDHLLSVDMLRKLDAALNLRAHYSDPERDPFSRLWFANASMEWFHRHYLSRVNVEFDDYAGILIIKSQSYDPGLAKAITSLLVQEGEGFMNGMAHNLAQDQVSFLEKQVAQMKERVMQARQKLLAYQDKKGLLSPQATTENIADIIAKLEAQRTVLETQYRALAAYLVPGHANITQLKQQISAVENQITQEKAKLVSSGGKKLNRSVEEFQRLEMEAAFAQDIYKTALVALEKGRIEAIRTIKKVSVLQSPTQPEYALEPRRFYNTLVFMLVTLLLAGVAHLIAAIVQDHKD